MRNKQERETHRQTDRQKGVTDSTWTWSKNLGWLHPHMREADPPEIFQKTQQVENHLPRIWGTHPPQNGNAQVYIYIYISQVLHFMIYIFFKNNLCFAIFWIWDIGIVGLLDLWVFSSILWYNHTGWPSSTRGITPNLAIVMRFFTNFLCTISFGFLFPPTTTQVMKMCQK